MITKYTKEKLETVVEKSTSVSDVLTNLGLRLSGGSHGHISKIIKKYQINTDHFGVRKYKGMPPHNKKSWADVLIKKTVNRRESSHRIRRSLFELGREHKCELCGIGPIWNFKNLTLQIDHKDGDNLNNIPENLRFLCPNCHSQTSTFGSRKGKSKKCHFCKNEFVGSNRKYCSVNCSNRCRPIRSKKILWPDPKILSEMLDNSNFSIVAKKLGVSDNAIRKHILKFP